MGELPVVTARTTFEGRRASIAFPNGHPTCLVCGTCKRNRVLAHQAAGRAVVFIGDGESDRYAAGYADVVWAKRSLVRICIEAGWPFRRWTEFREIDAWLDGRVEAWRADSGVAPRPPPHPFFCGPEVWGDGLVDPPPDAWPPKLAEPRMATAESVGAIHSASRAASRSIASRPPLRRPRGGAGRSHRRRSVPSRRRCGRRPRWSARRCRRGRTAPRGTRRGTSRGRPSPWSSRRAREGPRPRARAPARVEVIGEHVADRAVVEVDFDDSLAARAFLVAASVQPVHHLMSLRVAGPKTRNQRRTSSARATSTDMSAIPSGSQRSIGLHRTWLPIQLPRGRPRAIRPSSARWKKTFWQTLIVASYGFPRAIVIFWPSRGSSALSSAVLASPRSGRRPARSPRAPRAAPPGPARSPPP